MPLGRSERLRTAASLMKATAHNALYFSIALFMVPCLSAGTANMNFSMVPTGPPQQGRNGLMYPGACPPTSSSIFFLAASFMASIVERLGCGELTHNVCGLLE